MKTHLPRRKLAVSLVAVCAVFMAACQLNPNQEQVAHYLNVSRRSVLGQNATIGINWTAQAKAQAWAEQLASEGRLRHSVLTDGMQGVTWCGLGENVGYGPSVKAINDAYMNSPGHRANIVNPAFNSMGVGYATGYVNGSPVVFTVQVFVQTC